MRKRNTTLCIYVQPILRNRVGKNLRRQKKLWKRLKGFNYVFDFRKNFSLKKLMAILR